MEWMNVDEVGASLSESLLLPLPLIPDRCVMLKEREEVSRVPLSTVDTIDICSIGMNDRKRPDRADLSPTLGGEEAEDVDGDNGPSAGLDLDGSSLVSKWRGPSAGT
jgi:hypothetical protein